MPIITSSASLRFRAIAHAKQALGPRPPPPTGGAPRTGAKSCGKPVEIGELMVGQTAGEVLESKHPAFAKGDSVLTGLGWQLFGCAKGDAPNKGDAKRAPLSYSLVCPGMPG